MGYMRPFPVTRFLELVRNFQEAVSNPEFSSTDPLREEDIKAIEDGCVDLIKEAEECGLPSTADQFVRIAKVARDGSTSSQINQLGAEMINRLQDECRRHLVMVIEKDYAKYFSNAQFFDADDPAVNKVSMQLYSRGWKVSRLWQSNRLRDAPKSRHGSRAESTCGSGRRRTAEQLGKISFGDRTGIAAEDESLGGKDCGRTVLC